MLTDIMDTVENYLSTGTEPIEKSFLGAGAEGCEHVIDILLQQKNVSETESIKDKENT